MKKIREFFKDFFSDRDPDLEMQNEYFELLLPELKEERLKREKVEERIRKIKMIR